MSVRVLCGLPKGDKTDYIIQKCVESGAKEICFFRSERVVQRTEGVAKKLERWNRISEEAAKQSGRGIIPEVRWIDSFVEALDAAKQQEDAFFLYETGERESLRSALKGAEKLGSAAVITGPEGGFEPYESDMARKVGLHICSMGARILRCETAPLSHSRRSCTKAEIWNKTMQTRQANACRVILLRPAAFDKYIFGF